MSAAATTMLEALQRWRLAGRLRALDVAFARLLHELDGEAPPSLLLAGALAAQMEGRGHDCIELASMTAGQAPALLGWASPSSDELCALLPDWAGVHKDWEGSPLVETDSGASGARAASTAAAQGAAQHANTPLVLHRGRLYLRRYWTWESRVAAQVRARTAAAAAAEAPFDATDARLWLDRLFPAAAPSARRGKARAEANGEPAVDWQKLACALALQGRLSLITGGPGTGKTYTAARLLVLLQALHRGKHPLRVALAAPTGKAAARLRQTIDAALADLRRTIVPELFEHDPTAAPGAARTLHALLGARPGTRRFTHDASTPLEVDVLFVDEASMVHLEMMAALLDALPPRARLVLLGDKDQLASVEAGAVLGDLCQGAQAGGYTASTLQHVQAVAGITVPARYSAAAAAAAADVAAGATAGVAGSQAGGRGTSALAQHTAMLRESHRFGGAIGELAAAVNRGDATAARQLLASPAAGAAVQHAVAAHEAAALRVLVVEGRGGAAAGYRACFERLRERPADPAAFEAWACDVLAAFDRLRVLCAVREGPHGVQGANEAIEQALVEAKLLSARRGEWYEGRPVMVTRNDPGLGVFNGDIGIALAPAGPAASPLRVYFLEAGTLRSVASSRLADVQTAFALTVHKSQGSEFEHVLLLLPGEDVPVLTRELLYTAITRARAAFTLAAADPALVDTAVRRRTRRGSGLLDLLGS